MLSCGCCIVAVGNKGDRPDALPGVLAVAVPRYSQRPQATLSSPPGQPSQVIMTQASLCRRLRSWHSRSIRSPYHTRSRSGWLATFIFINASGWGYSARTDLLRLRPRGFLRIQWLVTVLCAPGPPTGMHRCKPMDDGTHHAESRKPDRCLVRVTLDIPGRVMGDGGETQRTRGRFLDHGLPSQEVRGQGTCLTAVDPNGLDRAIVSRYPAKHHTPIFDRSDVGDHRDRRTIIHRFERRG